MTIQKSLLFIVCILLISSCNTTTIKTNKFELQDHAWLKADHSKVAVILCHGKDKHPRWKVVEPLRKEIHWQLKLHTLSLQMPVDDIYWKDYQYLFPQAFQTIDQSIKYLKETHGVTKIFLLGHSMGSRMASAYIASRPGHDITGFIGIGMRNNGEHPLDVKINLQNINIPVLDLFGDGGNGRDFRHAGEREQLISKQYQQVLIKNANHKFSQHQSEMITAVISWLSKLK